MKVAVWGSCNFGNYGDDIMVLMYARFIKENGANPVVYRLDKKLANLYGIETVFTLDELIKEASFAMIAGGSWLEKHGFNENTFGFDSDMEDLLSVLQANNCPLYSFSIGGDGHVDPNVLTLARKRIFSSELYKGGTVRLDKDVYLLKSLGKDVDLFPDVVLSLPRFWKPKESESQEKGYKIGFQLAGAGYGVRRMINRINWLYPNKYYCINSHLPGYNLGYELAFEKESINRLNFEYEDPQTYIDFIASLDTIVSFKLHPSVTAIAYNVPCLLLGGLNKTKEFLKSIHAENSIIDARKVNRHLITNNLTKVADSNFDWKIINEQAKNSFGHFDVLKSIINKYEQNHN